MAVEYSLRIYTPAGSLCAVVTDFRRLVYEKKVNAPGILSFDLAADHPAIAYFELDAQVEVWRKDSANGIYLYCDFYAFWRDEERATLDDGVGNYRAICVGQMDILDRYIVAYATGTPDYSLFSAKKPGVILDKLITYNATSSATTGAGRLRNADLPGTIITDMDTSVGNTISYSCAYKSLLVACQEVALLGNIDFYIAKNGDRSWYVACESLLGTDRSATVTFALNYGNMRNPVLRRNLIEERTVAIVGGQGTDATRAIVVRTGANYSGTVNSREIFVNGSEYSGTAGLAALGDLRMFEYQAYASLDWEVIQVPNTLYGKHYFVGDLVTGYYQGISEVKQIDSVIVRVESGSDSVETIEVKTADA